MQLCVYQVTGEYTLKSTSLLGRVLANTINLPPLTRWREASAEETKFHTEAQQGQRQSLWLACNTAPHLKKARFQFSLYFEAGAGVKNSILE